MQKKVVTLNTILKRSSCINSVHEASIETDRLYNNMIKSPDNITTRDISVYIESLCSTANAFKYYFQPLELLEKVTNTNVSDFLVTEYCNRVIPYMDINTLKYTSNYVNDYKIRDTYKDSISETVKINIAADRIIHNTKKLQENGLVLSHRNTKSVVENCINTVSKYNLPSYQKLNLCIEEAFYLLEKNEIKYDMSDIIKTLVEHYRYTSNLSADNVSKVLSESYVISNEDAQTIGTITFEDTDTVKKVLANLGTDINDDTFSNIVYSLNGCTGKDLIVNIADIIGFFRTLLAGNIVSLDKVVEAYNSIMNTIETYIIKSCNEDACGLVNKLIENISTEATKFASTSTPNDPVESFKHVLYNAVCSFRELYNTLYSDDNIARMTQVTTDVNLTTESVATLAVSALQKIGRFLILARQGSQEH